MNHGDDGKTCGGREVVISPGGGGNGRSEITHNSGVHSETAGDHCGTSCMPPHI